MSTIHHSSSALANPNNQEEGVKAMKGIDKRLNKDGTARYRVRIRMKGHPIVTETFSNMTVAKKWKRKTEVEIEEGRYFDKVEAQKHTFGEMIDRYIDTVLSKRQKYARNTLRHLNWWKDQLGDYSLDLIKQSLIAEKRDLLGQELTYRQQHRSPTTVIRYLSSLSHVFTIACNEWAWVTLNPVRKVTKPKLPNGRTRFLSEEEIKKVLEACQASKCRDLYIAVVLAMSTAMRYGEIMNLKKTDIDFSLNVITLYETKNGEVRSIPLEDLPRELVKEWVQSLTSKSPLVFPSPHDPKRSKDIRSAWDNAIKKAGIENFRFHDLRHTAASYLAIDGHSLLDIATLLGHKSLQMTKRYAHLSQDYKRRMVSSNNKRLFGEKNGAHS